MDGPEAGRLRLPKPAVAALCALMCVWVPVASAPHHVGGSTAAGPSPAGVDPGLPAYVGSATASALLQHRVDTVGLSPAAGEGPVENPSGLAYDHATASFYVAAPPSSVDVVPFDNGSLQVTDTFAVGTSPFALAVDNATHEVFVSNTGSDNVTVLSDAAHAIVGTIPVGSEPYGLAVDPSTGDVYVANGGSDNVSVISADTLSVVATVPVSADPMGVAFDPVTGELFVADHDSNQVTVISAATASVVATVPVGLAPYGVAVDTSSGAVYVTDEGSSNVSVISAVDHEIIATVPVVYPYATADLQGIAYDPRDGLVWAGAGAYYAVVIDPGSQTVRDFVNTDPSAVVFDPDSGDVCVTNTANVTFECFLFPYDATPTVPVQVDAIGLPTGTSWTVSLSGGYAPAPYPLGTATGRTMLFSAWPGAYTYEAWPTDGYGASPSTGVVDVTGPLGAVVNISYYPVSQLFPVTFEETGLPSGTLWYVNVSDQPSLSGSGTTLEIALPDGSYTYTAQSEDPAFSASGGEVTVNGASLNVSVPFSEPVFGVTFHETGLPNGTEWTVNVVGVAALASTTANAMVSVPNGTYTYVSGTPTANWTGSGGSFRVAGEDLTLPVAFHAVNSSVTLNETGLPPAVLAAYGWTASLHSVSDHTSAPSASFTIPNGTYGLLVTGPTGYASNGSGRLTVAGATHATVSFVRSRTVALTFGERGLPRGQLWCVEVDSTERCSTGGSLRYANLSLGGYAYKVLSPLAHQSITARLGNAKVDIFGTLDLTGNSRLVLTFVYPYAVTFRETGAPNGSWSVTIRGSAVSNATGSPVVFQGGNGTYTYRIGAIPGYRSTASPRPVVVNGKPATVTVTFSKKHAAAMAPFVPDGELPSMAPSVAPLRTATSRAGSVPM